MSNNEQNDSQISKSALKKLAKKQAKEDRKAENMAKQMENMTIQEDFSVDKYGQLPIVNSKIVTGKQWNRLNQISKQTVGKEVILRGRFQSCRVAGKLCFVIFREKQLTVQCLLSISNTVSKQMFKFVSNIPRESIIDITGIVNEVLEPVRFCTFHNFEINLSQVFIVSKAQPQLPLQIEDATKPDDISGNEESIKVNQDTRLNNRCIDLRTVTNQSIYRLQAAVCQLFREFLNMNGFIELQFPKIISAASEGGANVFQLTYFNKPAYLAQSPQLYKQMSICADFERVYTVGPVFRAEDSNTHRHLCEFTGLDLEMAFYEDYHEVVKMIGNLFTFIFKGLETRHKEDIEIIKRQFPSEAFEYLEEPLILTFSEGIKMLKEAGVQVGEHEDLSTPDEIFLGKLVKDKYHTDFYILDKYPLAVRPFYTMPDPNNELFSNSYDMFMRGEEILSGAQRIHDSDLLTERAIHHKIDLEKISAYIDSFKYGAPPHAGGGIGLERVLSFYLKLGNIRKTSMFPRDPKRLTP